MNSVEINSQQCTQCGICIEICPSDVLEMGPESSHIIHPELCITCGHCAAICPENAIQSHPSNIRTPFTLSKMPQSLQREHLLFHQRVSVRNYTAQELEKDTIKTMIQYGEKAPSSHNFRQRHYVVITDQDMINRMETLVVKVYRPLAKLLTPPVLKLISLFSKGMAEEMTELSCSFKNLVKKQDEGTHPVFRGAPCVIIISGPKSYDQSKDDCIAAQNYMMLYAQSIGIGSCIMGYAQYPHKKLARFLNLPGDQKIHAVTIFGYPEFRFEKRVHFDEPSITWK